MACKEEIHTNISMCVIYNIWKKELIYTLKCFDQSVVMKPMFSLCLKNSFKAFNMNPLIENQAIELPAWNYLTFLYFLGWQVLCRSK